MRSMFGIGEDAGLAAKRAVAVLLGGLLATLVVACGGVSGPNDGGDSVSKIEKDPNKQVKLAVFLQSTENTYFQADGEGAQAAAKEDGNTTVKLFNGQFNATAQAKQIEDANTSGQFNAYVVMANDGAAVVPAVKEAISKGIPVVAGYVPIGPDITKTEPQIPGVVATVWHDEPGDGTDQGNEAIKACKTEHPDADPCKIGYISGGNALPYEKAKLDAFKAAIAKSKQPIELTTEQEGLFLRDKSRTAAENMLQANPDLNVLITTGDQMTLGAEDAVKSAGLTGQVTLMGDGTSVQGVEAVDQGRWFSSSVYLPFDEGKDSANIAIDAARGIAPKKTGVLLREQSPVGPVYDQDTTKSFKGQWEA